MKMPVFVCSDKAITLGTDRMGKRSYSPQSQSQSPVTSPETKIRVHFPPNLMASSAF